MVSAKTRISRERKAYKAWPESFPEQFGDLPHSA